MSLFYLSSFRPLFWRGLQVHRSENPSFAVCFWVLLLTFAFHPIQIEALLWPIHVSWFAITFILVLNACAIERLRAKSMPFLFISCLAGTFFSAQGAFCWFAVSMHYALCAKLERRWLYSTAFFLAGVGAVSRIVSLKNGTSYETHLTFGQLGDVVIYFLQLVGSSSGSKSHRTLLITGVVLTVAACALLFTTVRHRYNRCGRLSLALIFASMSSLLTSPLADSAWASIGQQHCFTLRR